MTCCSQLGSVQPLNINCLVLQEPWQPQMQVCQIQCSAINQTLASLRRAGLGQQLGCTKGQGLLCPQFLISESSAACLLSPGSAMSMHFTAGLNWKLQELLLAVVACRNPRAQKTLFVGAALQLEPMSCPSCA